MFWASESGVFIMISRHHKLFFMRKSALLIFVSGSALDLLDWKQEKKVLRRKFAYTLKTYSFKNYSTYFFSKKKIKSNFIHTLSMYQQWINSWSEMSIYIIVFCRTLKNGFRSCDFIKHKSKKYYAHRASGNQNS